MILAEELGHYWQTSRSSPDSWMDKTKKLIEDHGGVVRSSGYAMLDGREAFMLVFELDGDHYKVVWPVLPTKKSSLAARIQAATLLYHDVKNRIVSAEVLGNKVAFFSYLLLPTGQTVSEIAYPDLVHILPDINRPLLEEGHHGDD